MASKKEGIYTKYLIDGIKAAGGVAWKIPDPVTDYMTVKRPYDVFGFYKGKGLAIECKWLKEPMAFGMRHLKKHQIEALNVSMKAGALCFVVLFIKFEKRIHMLVWRWEVFRKKVGPFGKGFITEAIQKKASTVTRGGVFPATWLKEVSKHLGG